MYRLCLLLRVEFRSDSNFSLFQPKQREERKYSMCFSGFRRSVSALCASAANACGRQERERPGAGGGRGRSSVSEQGPFAAAEPKGTSVDVASPRGDGSGCTQLAAPPRPSLVKALPPGYSRCGHAAVAPCLRSIPLGPAVVAGHSRRGGRCARTHVRLRLLYPGGTAPPPRPPSYSNRACTNQDRGVA